MPTIRLYVLPPRSPHLAGARRDPVLDALDAPEAGVFEAADRHLHAKP